MAVMVGVVGALYLRVDVLLLGILDGAAPVGRYFTAARVLEASYALPHLLMLALLGGADMVSVIIRHSLVQLATPDEMRGRVSAVNVMFIQASNELGEFESGLTAQWFGAVPAVILGGVGTLIIAGVWARLFPALRKVDDLGSVK